MEHGRHTSKPPADPSKRRVRIRNAAWLTVLAAAAAGAAQAQDSAPASASCASKIAAVLADIAARDLDTTEGPPLNAFSRSIPARWRKPKRSTAANKEVRCSACR